MDRKGKGRGKGRGKGNRHTPYTHKGQTEKRQRGMSEGEQETKETMLDEDTRRHRMK